MRLSLAFLIATLSTAVSLQAVPFTQGQVFASGTLGRIFVYNPDGTLVQTLNTTTNAQEVTGGAFDSNGNFFVTNFTTGQLSRFDASGNLVSANILSSTFNSLESIVFNRSGEMLVGRADGDADVRLINTGGNILTQYNVAIGDRGSDWVDLASDQRTLYYTSEGSVVYRYDLVTGTQLSNFATGLPRPLFALRLLSDGGVLVASGAGSVFRLNSSGVITQTYTIGGTLFGLNLDPDGTSFWTANISTGDIYRYDIGSGAQLNTFRAPSGVTGLAVFGEITQGGPQPVDTVPEPGTVFLTAVGLAVSVLIRQKMQG